MVSLERDTIREFQISTFSFSVFSFSVLHSTTLPIMNWSCDLRGALASA